MGVCERVRYNFPNFFLPKNLMGRERENKNISYSIWTLPPGEWFDLGTQRYFWMKFYFFFNFEILSLTCPGRFWADWSHRSLARRDVVGTLWRVDVFGERIFCWRICDRNRIRSGERDLIRKNLIYAREINGSYHVSPCEIACCFGRRRHGYRFCTWTAFGAMRKCFKSA